MNCRRRRCEMRRGVAWLLVLVAVPALLVAHRASTSLAADGPITLNVTADKAQLLVVGKDAFTKVVIANPSIADVQVISPSQLLITGKTPGETSLVLFYGRGADFYDVRVNPAALGRAGTPPPGAVPHTVLVQRADKVSESIFVKDKDALWMELSTTRVEAEVTKK